MTLRLVLVVSAIAFVLNWLWEMAHMGAYVGMDGQPWRSTAGRCARAAAVDAAIVLVLSAVSVRLAAGRRAYVVAGVLGLGLAAAIESLALSTGRWAYGPSMPLVPLVGLGVYPLIQLASLTPASLWLGSRLAGTRDTMPGTGD